MKNKHYQMIVAKAANMDLVVFENDQHGKDEWYTLGYKKLPANNRYDYFLCLPQHKEACLHWLNGGDVEVSVDGNNWEDYDLSVEYPKYPMADFTGCEFQFRVKPKKEKRWIAFNHENGNVYGSFYSKEICKKAWPMLQAFEIEAEV